MSGSMGWPVLSCLLHYSRYATLPIVPEIATIYIWADCFLWPEVFWRRYLYLACWSIIRVTWWLLSYYPIDETITIRNSIRWDDYRDHPIIYWCDDWETIVRRGPAVCRCAAYIADLLATYPLFISRNPYKPFGTIKIIVSKPKPFINYHIHL